MLSNGIVYLLFDMLKWLCGLMYVRLFSTNNTPHRTRKSNGLFFSFFISFLRINMKMYFNTDSYTILKYKDKMRSNCMALAYRSRLLFNIDSYI